MGICKYKQCGREFKRRNNGSFCCHEHYTQWKIDNFVTPTWTTPLKNWIVLGFDHRTKREKFGGFTLFWKIKCKNCGIEAIRGQSEVKRDSRCEHCKQRPQGQSGLMELFNTYKTVCAEGRGIPFDLTLEQFKEITSRTCHYCGVAPYKWVRGEAPSSKKHMNAWGNCLYNGVDRKDNDQGYSLENCLPCCEICNWSKKDRTYDDYVQYLDRVAKFRSSQVAGRTSCLVQNRFRRQ